MWNNGKGRLPEPSDIVEYIVDFFESKNINSYKDADFSDEKKDLKDLNILVTAGPTREAIDPVRYITNHSSGKMGYAIAQCSLKRGAKVKLISGPVNIPVPFGAEVENVTSAQQMHQKVMESYKDYDILIMVAAVADYRCEEVSQNKIKNLKKK